MFSYEVGQKVKVRYGNGYLVPGHVTAYDAAKGRVTVLCEEADGTLCEKQVCVIDVFAD